MTRTGSELLDGEELKASEKKRCEYNAAPGEDTITVEEFEIGEEKDVKAVYGVCFLQGLCCV